jgi:hypothetical protein
MAASSNVVSTSGSSLSGIWRKVQAGVSRAFNFMVEEWEWLQKLKKFEVNWSAREITLELDLLDDINTAVIPEGGYEAAPSSQNTVTATLTWININKRFTRTKTAQYIQQQQGVRGQLENQLRFQATKAVQGVRRKVGDMFYGLSAGTQAVCASTSNETIVLKDMYGITGLGSTSHNRKASDLFRVGERIAVITAAGTLVGISTISTIGTALTITTVTTIASITTGDLIKFANNLENSTLAGGTEHNLNFVGLLDCANTASIHGVSSSTYAQWNYAINNSSGGRFTTTKYQRLADSIANANGKEMDMLIWAQGVKRDVVSQLSAGLRFSDASALEIDGEAKGKGVSFNSSRRTPDGYAFGLVKSNSVNKMTLLDLEAPSESDGDKLQDLSADVFSIDYPAAMIWTARSGFGVYSSLDQS